MTILNDISYGSHERHKADIFVPEKVVAESGIIVFIHGGGWTSGDKTVHHPDANFFAERGYICASINYRYVSESINVIHLLDDVTQALKAIKRECASLGFDISRLILSGGSAGAHLALLYAYSKRDSSPVSPVAACCYCPPSDCTREDFLLGISSEFEEWKYDILSKVCDYKITKSTINKEDVRDALYKISPVKYVNKNCIPTAIFHGKADELIPIKHIYDFIDLLNSSGIENDFVLYENSNHALDKDPCASQKAKEVILRYAEKYLQ